MSAHSPSGRVFARRHLSACALSALLAVFAGAGAIHGRALDGPPDVGRIQSLVDGLKARLSIPEDVTVAIVPSDPLLVSVEPLKDRRGAFLLRLDDGFLDGLADGELEAVLAHELGHVWIFTHHPYLQTEALANRIAMRLVTRESLVSVYAKVWEHSGTKGDLTRFLGLSASH